MLIKENKNKELYPWQEKAIARFKDARAFMLNVCCGGGKTLASILIAIHKALPVIVIAPKNLCGTWQRELIEAGVDEKDIWVYEQTSFSKDQASYLERFNNWIRE